MSRSNGSYSQEVPQGVLLPLTEFDSVEDLSVEVYNVASNNVGQLVQRGLDFEVVQYGQDVESTEAHLRTDLIGEREFRQRGDSAPGLGHFAVINSDGDVKGLALSTDEVTLRRQRLPVPAALAVGPLTETYPYATPFLFAWVDRKQPGLLSMAFADLVYRSVGARRQPDGPKPWTAELSSSPPAVHDEIKAAGLVPAGDGRFDIGFLGMSIPKKSVLYSRTYDDWYTEEARLKELRINQRRYPNRTAITT